MVRWVCFVKFFRLTALGLVVCREWTGIMKFFQLLEAPCFPHPLLCMELGKHGKWVIIRILSLRAGVYFSDMGGGETRQKALKRTSTARLGKDKEEWQRTQIHVLGNHISRGLYWGYHSLLPSTITPLCGTILMKELVIQSQLPASLSHATYLTWKQSCTNFQQALCAFGVDKSGQDVPGKGQQSQALSRYSQMELLGTVGLCVVESTGWSYL